MTWPPEPQGPCPCKTCAGARCLADTGICEPGDECDTCAPVERYTPIARRIPERIDAHWSYDNGEYVMEDPPIVATADGSRRCSDGDQCAWCRPVTREWIENTDPAPVAEPDFVQARHRVNQLTRQTPEEFQATADAAAALGSQVPRRPFFIDRIRNATRRTT